MSNGRKVSTDALETLGQIIDDTQKRDAIHLAVLPMVAVGRLFAGQDIGLVEGGAGPTKENLGIVDPFLKVPVQPGQRFWMVLYPRMVTSLRHVWSHAAFDDEAGVPSKLAEAKMFIDGFAKQAGIGVTEVLDAAKDYLENGEYLCDGGRWEGFSTPPEFWDHYETVTGTSAPKGKRGGFFSCSC